MEHSITKQLIPNVWG